MFDIVEQYTKVIFNCYKNFGKKMKDLGTYLNSLGLSRVSNCSFYFVKYFQTNLGRKMNLPEYIMVGMTIIYADNKKMIF